MPASRRRSARTGGRVSEVEKDDVPHAPTEPVTVLFDTNVILDVVLEREPWADDAAVLLDHAARGAILGWMAGHAITTIYCIVARERGREVARTAVADLLSIAEVVELGSADFHRALALGLDDFEDAVQVAACLRAGARYLVTRNEKDFKAAPVTPRSAGEVLALLGRGDR